MNQDTLTRNEAKNQLQRISNFILSIQKNNGAIPWFENGKLDPWDHCEALMALSVAGHNDFFREGMEWLKLNQDQDGYWLAQYYGDASSPDRHKIDTNFVAYPATTLWHHYLCNRNTEILEYFFPCIEKATNYVLTQQNTDGDFQWARSEKETLAHDSLLTGNASILRSLESAIFCADRLGITLPHWEQAHSKLADCIKNKPWRFDRTWESKSRFSMDWFYPILSGSYSIKEAQLRLEQNWTKFVVDELGCKCVEDEPWVTVAESCELVIALIGANRHGDALRLFTQLTQFQDKDGGFWTGYQYKNKCIWPKEKTAWTAGAAVLALDALFEFSPACKVLSSPSPLLFS